VGRARQAIALAGAALLAACGGAADDPTEVVTVFAAASLTEAFTALAEEFEAARPGADVVLSFAGSQQLAAQIEQGAPADVFAAADTVQMDRLQNAGLVASQAQAFAHNRLTIVVETGNPLGIKGLADLGGDGVLLVLAAPEVPAGRYASEVLERAGVSAAPASLEADVRAARAKVELGEADAAIVYVTDAAASDDVAQIPIAEEDNVVAIYPIAVLSGAPNPGTAVQFVEFVLSEQGAAVLDSFGFARP
jgi:molybdate transport system substrate-binding protein